MKALYTVAEPADAPANISDLDSNRRAHAEQQLDRIAWSSPNAGTDEIFREAMRVAAECVPSTKDAAEQIAALRAGPAFCYLAFHGLAGKALFVKIGMTAHPEQRLYGMATGNPLDCLWVYTATLSSRKRAFATEQAILRHLSAYKRRGEWVEVDGIDEATAAGLASALSEIARENGADHGFALLGYTDGRKVA